MTREAQFSIPFIQPTLYEAHGFTLDVRTCGRCIISGSWPVILAFWFASPWGCLSCKCNEDSTVLDELHQENRTRTRFSSRIHTPENCASGAAVREPCHAATCAAEPETYGRVGEGNKLKESETTVGFQQRILFESFKGLVFQASTYYYWRRDLGTLGTWPLGPWWVYWCVFLYRDNLNVNARWVVLSWIAHLFGVRTCFSLPNHPQSCHKIHKKWSENISMSSDWCS